MARAYHSERLHPNSVEAVVSRFNEAFVHRAIRRYLKANGWTLVAGQWPGGTNNHLHTLYIVDPTIAKDSSPDPRRHSLDKFVPDVVALKNSVLLIIEAKTSYSHDDFAKLQRLLLERREDLYAALRTFGRERSFTLLLEPELLSIRPALAFRAGAAHPPVTPPWVMFLVDHQGTVEPEGNLL